jgi:hypothetical protein
MISKYKINDNNLINFELIDNFAVIHFIHFDNPNNLFACMKEYFDHIASLDGIDFLGSYPGCSNPLVVRAGINVIKQYGFNYRIFYDKNEVDDIQKFEEKTLDLNVEKIQSIIDTLSFVKGLHVVTTNIAINNGFKDCAVFSPLKRNYDQVKLPVKFYEIDKDGFLIAEFEEKPKNNKNYYQSIKIKKIFPTHNIKLENGKPKYHAK